MYLIYESTRRVQVLAYLVKLPVTRRKYNRKLENSAIQKAEK
jgi:hypothetical protein